jgi:tetratricopeptide (TPR) repeat protein
MKVFLITLAFMGCTGFSFAQDYNKVDSLLQVLAAAKNDTARVLAMHDVAYNYLYSNTDSSAWYAQQAMTLSKKINYERGVIRSMNDIGNALNGTGSYSTALEIFLEVLERSEKLQDEKLKGVSFNNIGEVYKSQGDYREAISYGLRSLAINLAMQDTIHQLINYINLGEYYEKANLLDSGLTYANQAYQLALKINDVETTGDILLILGNIHSGLGNDDIALPYYRKAVLANQLVGNDLSLSKSFYSMAQLFKRTGNTDSGFVYLKKSYETALKISDKNGMLVAATLLASLYEKANSDSTLKYLRMSIALKDSLFTQEKTRQVQSLTINEQLRQSKMEEEKELATEERKKNLQMAGIGAFIPLFFGIVLLVSKRKAKPKTIQFMGLLGLLLMFEFISLFLHPYIGEWTHHTPVLMLLILVLLAALLVPMHHKLEHWIKEKLAHKANHTSSKVAIETPAVSTNENI